MYSTTGTMALPTMSGSRQSQGAQRKYYPDGFSFRVFRAPVISSFPYTAAAKLDPGYRSTQTDTRPKYDWRPYRDSGAGHAQAVDDRTQSSYYFSGSDRTLDNQRAATGYSIYASRPQDDYVYERPGSPKSDTYSVSEYDDFSTATMTPTSSFSVALSDDSTLSLVGQEPSEVELKLSDYSRPSTPFDSHGSKPASTTTSQLYSNYSNDFRNRADYGYNTLHSTMPVADHAHSVRSGSVEEARFTVDARTHSGFYYSRPESVSPSPTGPYPSANPPYAESALSSESDDEVHTLAKINAEYNAATSSAYAPRRRNSLIGQDYPPIPSVLPSVTRVPTPVEDRTVYTESPLTSSPLPLQVRNPNDPARSDAYHGSTSPLQQSPDRNDTSRQTLYVMNPSHRSSTPRPSASFPNHSDEFIPPLANREWDETKVASSSKNVPETRHSPQSERYSPTSRSRRSPDEADKGPDGGRDDALPIPPPSTRRYNVYEGPLISKPESTNVRGSPDATSRQQTTTQSRRTRQHNETEQRSPVLPAHYSSNGVRGQSSSHSARSQPSAAAHTIPPQAVIIPNTNDGHENAENLKSSSQRYSPNHHRRSNVPEGTSAPDSKDSNASPSNERHQSTKTSSPTSSPVADHAHHSARVDPTTRAPSPVGEGRKTRAGRTSHHVPDSAETSDKEGVHRRQSVSYDRQEKLYSSSPEDRTVDRTKHSRQDRVYDVPANQRNERASHPTSAVPGHSGSQVSTTVGKPFEYERRRKDSVTQRQSAESAATKRGASSTPLDAPVLSPTLVPVAKPSSPLSHQQGTKLQGSELPQSHSRETRPTTEVYGIYQRPYRRNSDGDRPSTNPRNPNELRSPSPPPMIGASAHPAYPIRPPTAPPEPHRRYSDGDVPQQAQPFPAMPSINIAEGRTPPPSAGGRRSTPLRTVRWNDNLICPSPILAAQRRKGWFNRRGDQLWRNDGSYRPAPAGQEYPPDLDDYPEYGHGWMNEEGIRIDMGHRLIPRLPLRSALKQSQT
ncbi:hypothetical protein AX17_005144 [Amanita inopinata Kibby_2008]|nr:hypothetical protein AX17_005144 [Amanita inopinata Kibby_2008]